ncbi:flippase [Candidatus Poribacteria bacterium]|nr:flippase [Candidatus Poribacteria bacterium]
MSTVQRIAKNTTVLLVTQVVSYLLVFLYMMYTARYLGPASFGILTFALAFTGIFSIFADLGLTTLTVREVARDKSLALKYLANVSLMKIVLAAITFGLIALIINLMGYPEETIRVVYLFGLYVIFVAFTQMFYSIFQAYERMEFQGIGQMSNAALILGGVIFAIKHGFSVVGFTFLFFIASAIVLVYSLAIMKLKFSNPTSALAAKALEFDWSFWKPTIKEALPFGLAMVFSTVFIWIDSVMLSVMKGDAVVGWYNAAYRMVLIPLLIPTAFNAAIFPILSRFYITSRESLKMAYEKYFKYMVILGIPIGVGTTLLAQRFILLIFGTEYSNSILPLQILIWYPVLVFATSPFARLFESLNKQLILTRITGICAALNVILNLILIPRYGLVGASIATVFTEFALLVFFYIESMKIGYGIPRRKVTGIIIRASISSALMGIFIMCFHNLTLLALLPLSALIYFLVLYGIRGVDKEDISLIKRAVERR